jgi:TPR repeat protein
MDFYTRGAAKNNAYCFFELSRIYEEGSKHIDLEPNVLLHFLYLKRAAEEGFVTAQHMLGIAYMEGKAVKRNHRKSLAWFRESVRNGNPISYLNAGDLLSHHSNPDDPYDMDYKNS